MSAPTPSLDRLFRLQEYCSAERYDEVCRKRFGRTYDLDRPVESVRELRLPGSVLRASHVVELFDPDRTHFGHFWKPPRDLEKTLEAWRIPVARPADAGGTWREEVVLRVFERFGSVEAASVLLRAVHPEEFAVYSPPLLNLLQLQAQAPVDHYLSYCDELRVWGDRFGTGEVARTDHALWLFYEWAYGPACLQMEDPRQMDAEARRAEFENDRWVRERQAKNVLRPFFSQWSTLDQAACLADVDANLAGKIAGCELETRLRQSTGLELEDMPSVIHAFCVQTADPALQRERKQRLRRAWKLRNRTVHSGSSLSPADVRMLIDTARELFPPEV